MNISSYIAEDLREAIRSGVNIPDDLTLAGLAKRYDTSVMPVRVAVDELVGDKFLIKQSNGRLRVNESRIGRRRRGNGKKSKRVAPPVDWYKRISEDIVRQSLQQQTEALTIDGTAEKHGIGRSIAQKVLIRLAGEGLIEHAPRKSWSIRPFREADLDGYIDVRSILELRALDLAKSSLDVNDLEEMLEQNMVASANAPAKIDNRLHTYWIDRSENRYIHDFYCRHSPFYLLLYRYAVDHDPDLIPSLVKQHRNILSAIITKRWRQAREALAHDIKSLHPILVKTIQRVAAES